MKRKTLFKNFFLDEMEWNGEAMIMEMGELWIHRQWTLILEWCYACQYYCVRLAKKFGWQIIFKKVQNSQWTQPLTKLNINKSCYVDGIWLW
jgi:hypothetical protein